MPTALREPARIGALPPESCGGEWCCACGKVHAKRPGDPRWVLPVSGGGAYALRAAIIRVMQRQHERVLSYLGLSILPPLKAASLVEEMLARLGVLDLSKWARQDAVMLKPAVQLYTNQGGQQLAARLGFSIREPWNVRAPEVQTAIEHHAIRLCRDTARTTNLALRDAVNQLRGQLIGELAGEEYTRRSLVQAVSSVFTDAETWRAQRIAVTEASMAIHDGEILAGDQSGVVLGYEPLVSPDACDLCLMMAEAFDFVPMEEALAGLGEYAGLEDGRSLPPYHTNCQCTQTERLTAA